MSTRERVPWVTPVLMGAKRGVQKPFFLTHSWNFSLHTSYGNNSANQEFNWLGKKSRFLDESCRRKINGAQFRLTFVKAPAPTHTPTPPNVRNARDMSDQIRILERRVRVAGGVYVYCKAV